MAKFSVSGLFSPKSIKRRLFGPDDNVVPEKLEPQRRWQLLQVEPALACNLRCVMCPWREISDSSSDRGIMSPKVWDAIRSHLAEVQSIDFTGGGEPLLQPMLVEWIAEAKDAGCVTGFLTNGMMLTRQKLEQILNAGLDWICISMDGATAEMYEKIRIGSSFERVCENVFNIAKLRKSGTPKTMINFVLMDINVHQIEDIVRLAGRLEVDQVNFKQCEVIRGDAGKGHGLFGPKETREIRRLRKSLEKARRLAKKLNISTTAFAFTPNERPVCEQDPRNSMFVRYDGVVSPCINLAIGGLTTFLGKEAVIPSVHYGRLPGDDLLELWNSETCMQYRIRFEQRAKKHDETMMNHLIGSSGSNREKTFQAAKDAMPEPPHGCNVCHYLYDI
jgi:MoaA/NifB/PqqE/SkfB family radical SAM enzyme